MLGLLVSSLHFPLSHTMVQSISCPCSASQSCSALLSRVLSISVLCHSACQTLICATRLCAISTLSWRERNPRPSFCHNQCLDSWGSCPTSYHRWSLLYCVASLECNNQISVYSNSVFDLFLLNWLHTQHIEMGQQKRLITVKKKNTNVIQETKIH